MVKVRNEFGGKVRFKSPLRGRNRINSVIILL